MPEIRIAQSPQDVARVRTLFREYAKSLGIDLGYQGFEAECAELPGAYALPRGRLLLLLEGDRPAGCAGLRPGDGHSCEMKRLYVAPRFREKGLGRLLVEAVLSEARAVGYDSILLDTLPTMTGALRLYETLGFVRRSPYFESPIVGNVFMELRL